MLSMSCIPQSEVRRPVALSKAGRISFSIRQDFQRILTILCIHCILMTSGAAARSCSFPEVFAWGQAADHLPAFGHSPNSGRLSDLHFNESAEFSGFHARRSWNSICNDHKCSAKFLETDRTGEAGKRIASGFGIVGLPLGTIPPSQRQPVSRFQTQLAPGSAGTTGTVHSPGFCCQVEVAPLFLVHQY